MKYETSNKKAIELVYKRHFSSADIKFNWNKRKPIGSKIVIQNADIFDENNILFRYRTECIAR